eukprot:9905424-Heterocapsa_arctica.AAC.1
MGSAQAAIRSSRSTRQEGVHPLGLRAAVPRPSGDALSGTICGGAGAQGQALLSRHVCAAH